MAFFLLASFKCVDAMVGPSISEEEGEIEGLGLVFHDERGYNL